MPVARVAPLTARTPAMPPSVLKDGDVLSGRFKVVGDKPIGAGQFAEVFKAIDEKSSSDSRHGPSQTGAPPFVAIKIEREEKTTTRELRALTDLQGVPGVCSVLASGNHKDKHPFIVMELGGENLFDVRHKNMSGKTHSKGTISWIGCKLLDTLHGIHNRGYVHRDVKPSNVTVGVMSTTGNRNQSGTSRDLLLIDLGLAKKYETKDEAEKNALNPEAETLKKPVPFRGSTTYVSVNMHTGLEQGPRDDLWSLLYLLAEAHEGTLPWRALKTEVDDDKVKHAIHLAKKKCIEHPETLCFTQGTPTELIEFSKALVSIAQPYDTPDYVGLRKILESMDDRALDWEGGGVNNNGGRPVVITETNKSYKDVVTTSQPSENINKVRAILEHPESVPEVVRRWIEKIGEELDVSHASSLISGILSSAIKTNFNNLETNDDDVMRNWVLDIFDQAAQAGRDARAIVEERSKRRRTG